MLEKCLGMFKSKSSTWFDKHFWHECPFKHAPAGVIRQDASVIPTSFLHAGSFQLERCTTQRVVSAGRYQTEPRWFSSCVKSYVGALSLEPSDMSMLHNWCNRSLYIVLYRNYSPTHLSTALPPSHESRANASNFGWLQLFWFWSKAVEVSTAQVLMCGPCSLLSRNSVHCIDWVGYFENLAAVQFADLHWRTCFFLHISRNSVQTNGGCSEQVSLLGRRPTQF